MSHEHPNTRAGRPDGPQRAEDLARNTLPPLPSAIPSDEELLAQIAADPDAAPLLSADALRVAEILRWDG
jgi:hypothetical protein